MVACELPDTQRPADSQVAMASTRQLHLQVTPIARMNASLYFTPNRSPTLIGMEMRSMPFTLTSVTLLSKKMRVPPLPTL